MLALSCEGLLKLNMVAKNHKLNKTKKNSENKNKTCIIYCRVATTEKQSLSKDRSIKRQERICKAYAKKQGYSVIDIVYEQGSGSQINKNLSSCVKSISKNQAEILIAADSDRISRSTPIFNKIRKTLGSRLELSNFSDVDKKTEELMNTIMSWYEHRRRNRK